MYKQIISLLLLYTSIVSAGSAVSNATLSQLDMEPTLTVEGIYEHPQLWPARAALLPGAGLKLGDGFPAVVLRVEPNGSVLLDFGRDGQHLVQINQTDLMDRAIRLLRGEESKDFPNFVSYSFNAFVSYTAPKEPVPAVAPELLTQVDYLVLLYVNADFLENAPALEVLSDLDKNASQHNAQILFVPTKINFYQSLASSSLRNIYLINHFSFMAYVKAFGHHPGSGLTAVVIDPEGKLYSRLEASEGEDYSELLKEVGKVLEFRRKTE
jgi:hypothetical protein